MRKKAEQKVEVPNFTEVFKGFADKNITREDVETCLKQSFESIFKKKNYEDTRAEATIDLDKGICKVDVYKTVVDEVIDDNLEIALEDAQAIDSNLKVGDDYCKTYQVKDFSAKDIRSIISVFRQKIKDIEKRLMYEEYVDKQGELIECEVERIEEQFTLLNIGRANQKTTIKLPNSHKIGDEKFKLGQRIKVYLTKVEESTGETKINVSRADQGFLRRLFEEYITEVANGTVVIKDVARQSGQRSKVSVYSNDLGVDPVGACIGPGGSKIQSICSQLGSERVDIVQYSEYPGLYIADALKPANVLAVKIDEQTKSAVAIVSNDDLRIAIGVKGSNASLAVRLTGWKIDIKEESVAQSEGIVGYTIDQMKSFEKAYAYEKQRKEILARAKLEQEQLEQSPVEEEIDQVEEAIEEVEEKVLPVEEKVVSKPVEEEKEVEYKPVQMQPKISLADLEKQIEDEKKKKVQQPVVQKKKVVVEEVVEPVKEPVKPQVEEKKIQPQMAIYSDEELEEMEDEEYEENNYDDDTDYSEYDKYYED